MYNSIYPININYRKYNAQPKANGSEDNSAQNSQNLNNQQNNSNKFPNGTKTTVDYTSGQINISQVLTDFKNTIIAINAPENISEEVSLYLSLVDRESRKENPSKDIILSNLKNASRISDEFITNSLHKKSNVVEGWIDALFMQKINLKADPDEINPAFQLEFPKAAQEKIDAHNLTQSVVDSEQVDENDDNDEIDFAKIAQEQQEELSLSKNPQITTSPSVIQNMEEQDFDVESEIEINQDEISNVSSYFEPGITADIKARDLFIQAKSNDKTPQGYTESMNLLNEALGLIEDDENANENIRAAIHFERGKIFDEYDYVDYALRDYHEATKSDEYNLKAQAYYKSGLIYDEFREYSPALDNYFSSVAYSGEADNYVAQTTVLSKIADLYAKQYDEENLDNYSQLALDSAQSSQDSSLVAETYSNNAQNYQYVGNNDMALSGYKNALALMSTDSKKYEETAYNYEQAANVMRNLGNNLKADKLQAKALLYYQKAQQLEYQQELLS